ncbi:DUF1440 domain-containing protein [Larkinella bovis]|uniref:DUF1440 domain-containing protein n=1 Tax=Larkinella bovis TaxID=683041 RepID=A0ABW0I8F0_9BACT
MAATTTSPFKSILLAGFIAGTLDITAAITILGKMNAPGVLRFIASGFFGKEAFTGGSEMVWVGLFFHFLIAFSFTIVYYLIFPFVPLFRHHRILSGLLYGMFVWGIMDLVVVPQTKIPRASLQWEGALLNMAILMVCVGLPISFFISRHYSFKR